MLTAILLFVAIRNMEVEVPNDCRRKLCFGSSNIDFPVDKLNAWEQLDIIRYREDPATFTIVESELARLKV